MKVFIATPTAGGVVKTEFANTLVGTILDLKNRDISVRYMNYDGPDIVLARNYLASLFMEDDECTHLFFVDSDMAFSGALCHRLIQSEKSIIAAACPRREMDMHALKESLQSKSMDINGALASSTRYNVKFAGGTIKTTNGLCQVDGIGTAVMLIGKTALTKMIDMDVATIKKNDHQTEMMGLSGGLYNFFDPVYVGEDYLSEDLSFCSKWKEQCNGEIWAVVDEDIGHVGSMRYGVPYQYRLEQGLL